MISAILIALAIEVANAFKVISSSFLILAIAKESYLLIPVVSVTKIILDDSMKEDSPSASSDKLSYLEMSAPAFGAAD